jgi:hypothetical protein
MIQSKKVAKMKLFASLLLPLIATPFTMGLKADQLNEGSVLRQTKGSSDDDITGKVSTRCCNLASP